MQLAKEIAINITAGLFLTLIIEGLICVLIFPKDLKLLKAVFFANLITNPILNILISLIALIFYFRFNFFWLLPLEIMVIITEWQLLKVLANKNVKKFLFLSILINLSSFFLGHLLFS